MAMFNRAESPKERTGTPARALSGDAAISIIGPGMRIDGDITTDGTVRIEGAVHGSVRAGKAVVLGKEGEITGDVHTQDAVIGGRVVGTIVAESRLELQNTCAIEGEIRARAEHLQLDEGARFSGQVQMIETDGKAAPASAGAPEAETKNR